MQRFPFVMFSITVGWYLDGTQISQHACRMARSSGTAPAVRLTSATTISEVASAPSIRKLIRTTNNVLSGSISRVHVLPTSNVCESTLHLYILGYPKAMPSNADITVATKGTSWVQAYAKVMSRDNVDDPFVLHGRFVSATCESDESNEKLTYSITIPPGYRNNLITKAIHGGAIALFFDNTTSMAPVHLHESAMTEHRGYKKHDRDILPTSHGG